MNIVAVGLAVVLLSLAAMHVYWAMRGVGATSGVGTTAGIPSRPDGTPVFRPGRLATLSVAVALSIAAFLVAGRAHLVEVRLSPDLFRVGVWGVAATFTLRTIGEFRYVGLFKRVHGTPFARWDTRVFTPLCAAIAAAAVVVARV